MDKYVEPNITEYIKQIYGKDKLISELLEETHQLKKEKELHLDQIKELKELSEILFNTLDATSKLNVKLHNKRSVFSKIF